MEAISSLIIVLASAGDNAELANSAGDNSAAAAKTTKPRNEIVLIIF